MENTAPDVKQKEAVRLEVFTDRASYAEWLSGRLCQLPSKEEVYEIIKGLRDPEYPLTLEELAVVTRDQIQQISPNRFHVNFTPTVAHCSQASAIGLSIKTALQLSFPPNYHVSVAVKPHTHNSATAITKQINDKERVCAALENPNVRSHIGQAIVDTKSIDSVIACALKCSDEEHPPALSLLKDIRCMAERIAC